jgi:hypothetical protein
MKKAESCRNSALFELEWQLLQYYYSILVSEQFPDGAHLPDLVSIFPSQAFCFRLVSAVIYMVSDEWQTCRAYFDYSRFRAAR